MNAACRSREEKRSNKFKMLEIFIEVYLQSRKYYYYNICVHNTRIYYMRVAFHDSIY